MLFTPTADQPESIFSTLLQRGRAWRERQEDVAALAACGRSEAAHIARDLSLTTAELHALARKGADTAAQLYRRMADLGLDRDAIAYREARTLRDMQKICSLCASKGRCRHDFARGAAPSAWHDYCPNDDTLGALAASVAYGAKPRAAAAPGAALGDDGSRRLLASLLGLIVVGLAWLLLLAVPPAGPDARATLTAQTIPAATCLDASCLSGQQQSALRDLRAVQTRGFVASTAPQLASLARNAEVIHVIAVGEATACAQRGGNVFSGFMYQNGCNAGAQAAAAAGGYGECLPMAGGGVCLTR